MEIEDSTDINIINLSKTFNYFIFYHKKGNYNEILSSNIKEQNNTNAINYYNKIKNINEENDLASEPDEIK